MHENLDQVSTFEAMVKRFALAPDLEKFLEILDLEIRASADPDHLAILLMGSQDRLCPVQPHASPNDLMATEGEAQSKHLTWVLANQKMLEVEDDPDGRSLHTILIYPLLHDGRCLGVVEVGSAQPSAFSDAQRSLLSFIITLAGARLAELEAARKGSYASEERYKELVESSADGILWVDTEGRIVFGNPTIYKMLDLAQHKLVGRMIWEPVAARSLDTIKDVFARAAQKETVRFVEIHLVGRNEELPVELSTVPIFKGSLFTGSFVILRDIKERKRAETLLRNSEARARQAQKIEALGKLAGGVAHDFNNLLTAINGYTELVLSVLPEKDPLRGDVEEIAKAGQQATELTRQLLAFSRKQNLSTKVVDMNILLQEMARMLGRVIGEDIDLELDLSKELARVKADPVQVVQVMMNLALNGRDAMPHGGKLGIKTQNVTVDEEAAQQMPDARPGSCVCVTVEDTGMGMDQQTLSRIFEPFYTTKGLREGTGLGLCTAYGIIRQHEGWITVQSSPGQGSKFSVYLPAFSLLAKPESPEVTILERFRGQGEGVLLVEDDLEVRQFAARALRTHGYRVYQAATIEQAKKIHDTYRSQVQILFSDVVLPDGDGVDLAESLLLENQDLIVILSSGYPGTRSRQQHIQGRGHLFLQKPYVASQLLAALTKAGRAA